METQSSCGVVMKFERLFKKIAKLKGKRKSTGKEVIDIETLEVYGKMSDLAKILGVSVPSIYGAIVLGRKVAGKRFEYLSEWIYWSDWEKEKYTRKNNIYFLEGTKYE